MSRHNLYMFRCDERLTQKEMAVKMGVTRQTYANVENGKRSGNSEFWDALQKAFDIPDSEMYTLMKIE